MRERGRLPMYVQIADELRAQINEGALPDGAQLPTEAELVERHGVSRATVREAFGVLINEGLVVAARPRGHFVRKVQPMRYRPQDEGTPRPSIDDMDAFMSQQTAEGRSPSQTIQVSIVQAPPMVANRFGIDVGESVVVRRRVRYLDGEPSHINDSFYRLDMVQGTEIMEPTDIARGANRVLAEHGYTQVRMVDEYFVRMPTPEEAQRLDLGPGTPVACHVCTGMTDDDAPVRVVVNVLPGDRHVIVYDRRPADAADNP